MAKPAAVSGQTKHDARAADRHNPTMPNNDAGAWARGLTTTRVADVFRTLQGLPGHWEQLQSAVNAGNNHFHTTTQHGGGFNDGGKTSDEGKILIRWISDAIISAAQHSKFDFPTQQLKFTRDMGWLKIARTHGRVVVTSKP